MCYKERVTHNILHVYIINLISKVTAISIFGQILDNIIEGTYNNMLYNGTNNSNKK